MLSLTLEGALDLIRHDNVGTVVFNLLRFGNNSVRFGQVHERLDKTIADLRNLGASSGAQSFGDIADLTASMTRAAADDQEEVSRLIDCMANGDAVFAAERLFGPESEWVQLATSELQAVYTAIQRPVPAQSPVTTDSGATSTPLTPSTTGPVSSGVESGVGPSIASLAAGPTVSSHEKTPGAKYLDLVIDHTCLEYHKNGQSEPMLLGSGSFGSVYKAKLGNKEVAVKKLHCHLVSKREKEDFRREVDAIYTLHHPALVQLFGSSDPAVERCQAFIVLEYLPVSLLSALYSDSPEPSLREYDVKVGIARDVASGLGYLHSLPKRVVHNDIKPENIMLAKHMWRDGGTPKMVLQAKLIDFGLANTAVTVRGSVAGCQQDGKGAGTMWYMSPEKLRGDSDKTSRSSDVYAYGITLYELTTGLEADSGQDRKHLDEQGIKQLVSSGWRPQVPPSLLHDTEMTLLIKLSQACWAQEKDHRPEITKVIACLRACQAKDAAGALAAINVV